MIVCLGDVAKTVEDAAALGGLDPQRRPVVARLDDLEHLPTQWYGYEGVDALVLSTSQPALYGKLAPGSPQLEALDQWVRMGGRLVLCVGGRRRRPCWARTRPWARFAPGRLQKMVSLRQTGGLEGYCRQQQRASCGRRRVAALAVPRLGGVEGVVEAREARSAAGDPHRPRLRPGRVSGRRPGPAAA